MTGEQGFAYSWDPLAAVATTVAGVERFQATRIRVLQADDEGRTLVDPQGTLLHCDVSADPDRFPRRVPQPAQRPATDLKANPHVQP